MTEIEKEVLELIRNHEDPEKARAIAIELLLTFLDEREAPQHTSPSHHRVIA